MSASLKISQVFRNFFKDFSVFVYSSCYLIISIFSTFLSSNRSKLSYFCCCCCIVISKWKLHSQTTIFRECKKKKKNEKMHWKIRPHKRFLTYSSLVYESVFSVYLYIFLIFQETGTNVFARTSSLYSWISYACKINSCQIIWMKDMYKTFSKLVFWMLLFFSPCHLF